LVRKNRIKPLIVFCLLFISFFLSCKSVPTSPEKQQIESGFIQLESGALVYIFIDAVNSREILNHVDLGFSQDKQFKKMLDKTQSAIIAVYPSNSENAFPQQMQISTWGKYPACMARTSMGFNKYWKKIRSDKNYYYSAKNGLSVVVNSKQAFISSSGEVPVYPVTAKADTNVPEGFNIFSKNAVLSCWIDNPGPFINQKLYELGFPIEFPAEKLFLSIYPYNKNYEVFLQLHAETATHARTFVAIIALARGLMPPITAIETGTELLEAILLRNSPDRDGNIVNIKSGEISIKELSLLFNLF